MQLSIIDWSVIAGYFVINISIGLWFRKRAGRSTSEFFVCGNKAPWWLAGTSMVAATFITKPEENGKLLSFYRRVRPNPEFWGPIAKQATDILPEHDGRQNLLDWAAGCVMVYMTLFGVGKIIFGHMVTGIIFLAIAVISAFILYRHLSSRGWKVIDKPQQ